MKNFLSIASRILFGLFIATILLLFIGSVFNACSSRSTEVNAETGEVVKEGSQLNSKIYKLKETDDGLRIVEYSRGGMKYLVFTRGSGSLVIINYTLDSIELTYHQTPSDEEYHERSPARTFTKRRIQ